MTDSLEVFLTSIPDLDEKSASELIEYFLFYLTDVEGRAAAAPHEIGGCFRAASIAPYSNIPAYLTQKSARGKGRRPTVIKVNGGGYRLERQAQEKIRGSLTAGPGKAKGAELLNRLMQRITDPDENRFLAEAIACYAIDARRATVVLVWNLTMFHLQRYVLTHHRASFDTVLGKNTDRRVKVTSVTSLDDFSDIPEGKFIEFLRSAGIISNDVRKILDTKLGIRNTYAHPNALAISDVKAADFVIDLVENVVLKYGI